jgi:hypothetical protein
MTRSVEAAANDANYWARLPVWPRSPSSERSRKPTAPADERVAIAREMDPSMVRTSM